MITQKQQNKKALEQEKSQARMKFALLTGQ